LSEARDAGEDLVHRSGPEERFGSFVMNINVLKDGAFQFFGAAEDATANTFVGDLGKPAFHQIQLGAVRGREMDVETGAFDKPVPDDSCLVRSIIVHHDVDIEFGWYVGLDDAEKFPKIPANGDADATAR